MASDGLFRALLDATNEADAFKYLMDAKFFYPEYVHVEPPVEDTLLNSVDWFVP